MLRKTRLLWACIILFSGMLNAQEQQELRWEFNLGMVNPFADAPAPTGNIDLLNNELLPVYEGQQYGLGIKYAFGKYAWRFSLMGASSYYSYGNPDINLYRSYENIREQGSIEFRMGVERRLFFEKAQFYFGSDLIMGRVRSFSKGSYSFLDTSRQSEQWSNEKRNLVSGIGFMVGFKYFFHEHFSVLVESRLDALGYEIRKNMSGHEEVMDTAVDFKLGPLSLLSINYHF